MSKLRESIKRLCEVNNEKVKEMLQTSLNDKNLRDERRLYHLMCIVPNGTIIEITYADGFIWRFTKTSTNESEMISHWDQQCSDDDFNKTEHVDQYTIMDYMNTNNLTVTVK